jgi:hypothetical protein
VQPLQASGFRYRPTRSPFKHKRVMMQQVREASCVMAWHGMACHGMACHGMAWHAPPAWLRNWGCGLSTVLSQSVKKVLSGHTAQCVLDIVRNKVTGTCRQ